MADQVSPQHNLMLLKYEQKNNNNLHWCILYCIHSVAVHHEWSFRIYTLCLLACLSGKHFLHTAQSKWQKSAPEIQRNIRNFRKECHIPLQLTELSLPECLLSGSAAQWEQIARNTKSDIGDRGGGRQRKLCQALLLDNNLSDLAINVSRDKINSQISWGWSPF